MGDTSIAITTGIQPNTTPRNQIRWKGDLNRVINESRAIHGDKYDYSLLRADQIINSLSRLNLHCNNCEELYTPTIDNFINKKRNCPCYTNNTPWKGNLSRVLAECKAIHGDDYDYSRLRADQIETCESKLDLTCFMCGKPYNPSINEFIHKGRNCRCHSNSVLWNGDLDRFLSLARSKHGDKYDYSRITIDMIQNVDSILNLPCNGCSQIYISSIKGFIHDGHDCPCYMKSKYSKKSIEWLNYIASTNNINIQHFRNGGEYIIPSTNYRVDGYYHEARKVYEFLGDYWHGNPKKYESDVIHPVLKKTMGQLYTETMQRIKVIQDLGYEVEYIWEVDWDSQKRTLMSLR